MVNELFERPELIETTIATDTSFADQAEKKKEQTALDAKKALQNVNHLIDTLKATPGEDGPNAVDVVMSFIRSLGSDMNDTDYHEGVPEVVANARLALIRTLVKAMDEASKYCQAITEHQLARHEQQKYTERIRYLNELKSSRVKPKSTEDIDADLRPNAEQMVVYDKLHELFAKQSWSCLGCRHRNPGNCEQCKSCQAVRPEGDEKAYIYFVMDPNTSLMVAYS